MKASFSFTERDFLPIESFPLLWRWTQATHNVLPPDALASIRPLTGPRAEQLWSYSRKFLNPATRQMELSEEVFASIHRIDTAGEAGPVREWLRELIPVGNPLVVVSWNGGLAVQTQWCIFRDYWDDFCYPMSDDVVVWPASEAWALTYWHEERVALGEGQGNPVTNATAGAV